MDLKVLFTRGEGCYIVQKNELFYLVNLDTDIKPFASEFVDSFLKFGYFEEVNDIDKNDLLAIKRLLSSGE